MYSPKIKKYNWFMLSDVLGCGKYNKIKLKLICKHDVSLSRFDFASWEKGVFTIRYVTDRRYMEYFRLLRCYLLETRRVCLCLGDRVYKFRYETSFERKKLYNLFCLYLGREEDSV